MLYFSETKFKGCNTLGLNWPGDQLVGRLLCLPRGAPRGRHNNRRPKRKKSNYKRRESK